MVAGRRGAVLPALAPRSRWAAGPVPQAARPAVRGHDRHRAAFDRGDGAPLRAGRSLPRLLRHGVPHVRADAGGLLGAVLASPPARRRHPPGPSPDGRRCGRGRARRVGVAVRVVHRAGSVPVPRRLPARRPGQPGRHRRRGPPRRAGRAHPGDPAPRLRRPPVLQHLPVALARLRAHPPRGGHRCRTGAGLRPAHRHHARPGRPVVPADRAPDPRRGHRSVGGRLAAQRGRRAGTEDPPRVRGRAHRRRIAGAPDAGGGERPADDQRHRGQHPGG